MEIHIVNVEPPSPIIVTGDSAFTTDTTNVNEPLITLLDLVKVLSYEGGKVWNVSIGEAMIDHRCAT
jgi:hypothetical protein